MITSVGLTRGAPGQGESLLALSHTSKEAPTGSSLDRLARLASRALRAPLALVSRWDGERSRTLGSFGATDERFDGPAEPVPSSAWERVIGSDSPLLVTDLRSDTRFHDELALNEAGVAACAGVLLRGQRGDVLGSLCVFDSRPREWTAEDGDLLVTLAESVVAEIELREEVARRRIMEQRLSLALEGAGQGLWDWDLVTDDSYLDPAWARRMGFGPAEAGRNRGAWQDRVHPDDLFEVLAVLEAHLSGIVPAFRAEYRMRDAAGEWRWVLSHGTVVERGRDGAPLRVTGIHEDITGRKAVESRLSAAEEHYRRLVETSPLGIFVLDGEGNIREANAALGRILGRSPGELLGRPSAEFVASEDLGWLQDLFGAPAPDENGPPLEAEFRVVLPSGEERIVWTWTALVVEHGSVVGVHGIASDVTGERLRQTALRQSEERARRMSERMRAVADAASGVLDATTVDALDVVLRRACTRVLPHDVLTFGVYDEESHALRFLAGWDGDRWEPGETIALVGRPSERVVRERRSVVTGRSDASFAQGAKRFGMGERSESVIRTPVLAGDRVLAVISVQSYTPDLFTAEEAEVLEALASVVASALKNIELLEQQEEAHHALEESQERFRAIADLVPDLLWQSDSAGSAEWYNRRWLEYTGLSMEQALGDGWLDAVHEEDRDRAHSEFWRAMGSGQSLRLEHRIRAADGSYRWFLVQVRPERDESLRITRWFGAATDIHERKRTEEALRESEARFRDMAESIPQVFCLSSASGESLYVSPAFEQVWGRTPEEIVQPAYPVEHDILPEDRERAVSAFEAMRVREVTGVEYRIRRPRDGEVRWVVTRGFPVRDGSGALVRIAGITEDITERRQLEEQYRQSQKMEAAGRLAGGIAHDFDHLLNVIKGRTQVVLEQEPEASPVREDLSVVMETVHRASALTQQLLAFSRKQVLQPRELDANEVLRGMERFLRRMVGEGVDTAIHLAAEPCPILADRGKIEQVILNLAVNARDAMPRGGRLDLRAWRTPLPSTLTGPADPASSRQYVCVEVADTGGGMDASTLGQLFDPFFTTKELGGGTGLGLATVYGIVQKSGGHITVESEPERGTAFRIYLPSPGGPGQA